MEYVDTCKTKSSLYLDIKKMTLTKPYPRGTAPPLFGFRCS